MAMPAITGLNGAGKTAFTVWEYLREPAPIETTDNDGQPLTIKRRLKVCGIPDLVLEHDMLHPGKEETKKHKDFDKWQGMDREDGEPPIEVEQSVYNWWLWCEPGDLIVVDEAQRVFRPAPNGAPVPRYIEKLETHRHYGVDFVLMTPHPQLLHSAVRKLVGPHSHVVGKYGGSVCTIFTWEKANANLADTKNAAFRLWRRPPAVFKLYRSTRLVTRTKQTKPLAVYYLPVLALLVAFLGWRFYDKRWGAAEGPTAQVQGAALPAGAPLQGPPAAPAPAGRPVAVAEASAPGPVVRGCYAWGDRCECIGDHGARLVLDRQTCLISSRGFDGVIQWAPQTARRIDERSDQEGLHQSRAGAFASGAPPVDHVGPAGAVGQALGGQTLSSLAPTL